jgi:hypothetical protein
MNRQEALRAAIELVDTRAVPTNARGYAVDGYRPPTAAERQAAIMEMAAFLMEPDPTATAVAVDISEEARSSYVPAGVTPDHDLEDAKGVMWRARSGGWYLAGGPFATFNPPRSRTFIELHAGGPCIERPRPAEPVEDAKTFVTGGDILAAWKAHNGDGLDIARHGVAFMACALEPCAKLAVADRETFAPAD